MGKIKWARVFANAGYTFFSIMVGSFSLGALLKLDIPVWYFLELSMGVAAFNAGLAFFGELKKETEEDPPANPDVQGVISVKRVETKEVAPDPPSDSKNNGHPMTRLANMILTI